VRLRQIRDVVRRSYGGQVEPSRALAAYGTRAVEEHQAGNGGSSHASCFGFPIQAASARLAGHARHRADAVEGGCPGKRLFLPRPHMSGLRLTRDQSRFLASENTPQSRARPGDHSGSERRRMARHDGLGMFAEGPQKAFGRCTGTDHGGIHQGRHPGSLCEWPGAYFVIPGEAAGRAVTCVRPATSPTHHRGLDTSQHVSLPYMPSTVGDAGQTDAFRQQPSPVLYVET